MDALITLDLFWSVTLGSFVILLPLPTILILERMKICVDQAKGG